ncbi:ABC-type phosphate transport system, substrate-binding protein [Frankineae bacterium MT45]|nr:ABC-type phosphate transport system, substrate-binding protein [Frankineae bacterium MT45]
MSRFSSLGRRVTALTAVAAVSMLSVEQPAGASSRHAQVIGTGSSWAANAVNQWVSDVQRDQGLQVVFTAPGSAQGRRDFANYNTDFAVSDLGYQGRDPKSGATDATNRPFAYLPLVAGGTAFPYNLHVGGQRVVDLRLSGATLAKIFTGLIVNWDDPAITADNNGLPLPSETIIPVLNSAASGENYQFSNYLARTFPALWSAYSGQSSASEYFPIGSGQVAESGSDGVMNYVSSVRGEGTIGLDAYSYALNAHYPIAKVLNSAGYYTLPTEYNVAVALTRAKINSDPASPDYLLQNLDDVYTNTDPRSYLLSSYSYGIIPTSATDNNMTTPKRQTLVDFLSYAVCGGQGEVGVIGYSPLPENLVEEAFTQIAKLRTADSRVDISGMSARNCANPTIDQSDPTQNRLATVAPQPIACDRVNAGPCQPWAAVAPTPSPTVQPSPTPSSTAPPTSGAATPTSGVDALAQTADPSTADSNAADPSTADPNQQPLAATGADEESPTILGALLLAAGGLALLAARRAKRPRATAQHRC